jgi:hypothetical protein
MRRLEAILWVAVSALILPASAYAIDNGGNILAYATATSSNPNSTVTLLNLSNTWEGSLRGLACLFVGSPDTANPPGSLVNIEVTVDNNAQQTITLSAVNFPADNSSTQQEFSGWLPYNIRFRFNLLIKLNRNNNLSGNYNSIICQATYDQLVNIE